MDTYEIQHPNGEAYELDWGDDNPPTTGQLNHIMSTHAGWNDNMTTAPSSSAGDRYPGDEQVASNNGTSSAPQGLGSNQSLSGSSPIMFTDAHAKANPQAKIAAPSMAENFMNVAPTLNNPRNALPQGAHVSTGQDRYLRILFPDNSIALKSPQGQWMGPHQWAQQTHPKNIPKVNPNASDYSDYNPFTWDYRFNGHDGYQIGDGIENAGQNEMNAGLTIAGVNPVTYVGGGSNISGKMPLPGTKGPNYTGSGTYSKYPTVTPRLNPGSVGATVNAVAGGLVAGGAASRYITGPVVKWINRKYADPK